MSKKEKVKVIERGSFGVKLGEKEIQYADICAGCVWKPFSGSCLIWRYRTPDICRAIKKMLESEPFNSVESPVKEFVGYMKVMIKYDHKTKEKEYKYVRIKSVIDHDGFKVVSIRRSTERRYDDYIRKKKKQDWYESEVYHEKEIHKQMVHLDWIPPCNPWIHGYEG